MILYMILGGFLYWILFNVLGVQTFFRKSPEQLFAEEDVQVHVREYLKYWAKAFEADTIGELWEYKFKAWAAWEKAEAMLPPDPTIYAPGYYLRMVDYKSTGYPEPMGGCARWNVDFFTAQHLKLGDKDQIYPSELRN